MPDKEIMIQIKAREEQLAWSALDALSRSFDEPDVDVHTDIPPENLHAALTKLAEEWRELASLYERAKGKGFSSAYVLPLRHAATQLDKVIEQLGRPRRAPSGRCSRSAPRHCCTRPAFPAQRC